MDNYFISTQDGSDSTGTGTATNPWKTINKAVGSSPAMPSTTTAPTTLHVEPGVYWGEAVTLGVTASASYPLTIRGDYDGSAFAAGGKSNPRTGVVDWRAWTNATTPGGGNALYAIGKPNVTLERVKITSGGANGVSIDRCQDLVIRDCEFIYGGSTMLYWTTNSTVSGLTLERCHFVGSNNAISVLQLRYAESAATWDVGVRMADCVFTGGYESIIVAKSGGSGGGHPTGFAFQNCVWQNYSLRALRAWDPLPSGAVTVGGCLFLPGPTALYADTLGQIVEDGNLFSAVLGPRTNVSAGSNSVVGVFPAFNFGDGMIDGSRLRPFTEPVADSPAIGFGRFGTPSATDLFGRARPASPAAVAAGALERAADPPGPACPPAGGTYVFQVEG